MYYSLQWSTPSRMDVLLALSAYVARQSRGMPIPPAAESEFLEAGKAAFNRRQGQLNLSCAQCHDDNWGKRLAGSMITQGQATGYPLYRLEWQAVGSLERRMRNCLAGIRAETPPYGAPELVGYVLNPRAAPQEGIARTRAER